MAMEKTKDVRRQIIALNQEKKKRKNGIEDNWHHLFRCSQYRLFIAAYHFNGFYFHFMGRMAAKQTT